MSQLSRLIPTSGPGSGTVTSITAGTGLTATPNPITTSGTISLTIPVSIADGGTNATSFTNTDGVVYFDGTRLVDTTVGTLGQVLTSQGAGLPPQFEAVPASSITITGDSGSSTGNNFEFTGNTTGLTFTSGSDIIDLGGTLVVSHGGTGQTTFTANELIASGSTATGAFQQITNGTAGQVLTANASGLPTFQNAASSGITTIDGDTGSVTGTTVSFIAQLHAGQTVKFSGSGTTMDLLVTDANGNTTIGSSAGAGGQSGSSNTSVGSGSLGLLSSGSNNTAAGTGASTAITTGSFNVSMGYGSLNSLKTGNYNIALGQEAGNAYTGSETANILIGNTGTVGESNVIRIGTQGSTGAEQNACYIAGIAGTTVSNINAVTINTATGQLGSEAFPSSSITITGDSGGGLSGNSFTFTGGSTGLTFAGSGTTETLGGTVTVSHGGTGDTSFTAYAPIAGGTTTTGALQSISSGISNSGYVLTSTGASSLPTWQAASASGITTIDGNTGSATGSTVTFQGTPGSVGTLTFSATGSTVTLNGVDANANCILGGGTLPTTLPAGSGNTGLGYIPFNGSPFTGNFNTGVGYTPFPSLTSGSHNVGIGQQVFLNLTTGSYNACLSAYQGGVNYTSSESNNIVINASSTTVAGESNVLRIGDGTGTGTQQVNKAFISGIYGITPSGSTQAVVINSSNQLGTSSAFFNSITVQTFTSSGTYTPTTGMRYCIIECIGGGGGGAGCPATTSLQVAAGGGGGGGGYSKNVFSASTIGTSQTVTIGAGGTGGTGNAGGNSGGTTSVGSLITASGGSGGGNAGPSYITVVGGGAGGSGSTANGGTGGNSFGAVITGSCAVYGGSGGATFYAGATPGPDTTSGGSQNNGNNGSANGGGGCGAISYLGGTAANGGTGGNGFVYITEFI